MQEYCGVDLRTKKFYIGSTKDLSRRLATHEKTQRISADTFWLIGLEHDDPNRTEEQFYLDFYWDTPLCLNLSPNSQLGNAPPSRAKKSLEARAKIATKAKGNTKGRINKGSKFYYHPETLETRRILAGQQPPEGWKLGNPSIRETNFGYSVWKDASGKRVRVYPGDDTTGLTPPALKRKDRSSLEFKQSRRKQF